MRRIEQIVDDRREWIVEEIARYLAGCRVPRSAFGGGAGDASARAAAMVSAFAESVEARKTGPFAAWAERTAGERGVDGWEDGEVAAALDLIESLVLTCADSAGPESREQAEQVVAAIVAAGREAYARSRTGGTS